MHGIGHAGRLAYDTDSAPSGSIILHVAYECGSTVGQVAAAEWPFRPSKCRHLPKPGHGSASSATRQEARTESPGSVVAMEHFRNSWRTFSADDRSNKCTAGATSDS